MSKLSPMWEALATYQPYANNHGFGVEWAKMCKEKTRGSTDNAFLAADADKSIDARQAAWCAASMFYRNIDDAFVDKWSAKAIENITHAIEKENL